jgi:O-antigen/teichoic acid export membrane protein
MKDRSEKEHALEILVAKNAGLSFGGSIVSIFIKLASSIIITRILGAQVFGIYILAVAIISFSEVIALFGMENSVVKFVSQFKALKDVPRLRGAIFGIVGLILILSAAVCGGLFVLSPYLAEQIFRKPNLISILNILAVSLPFTSLYRLLLASLQGVKLVKYKVLVIQLLLPLFRSSFIILTVLLGYGLKGLAYSYLITEIMGVIFSVHFVFRNIPEVTSLKPIVCEFKKILFFSTPLFLSTLFNSLLNRADTIIIGYFLQADILGIYGIAKRCTLFILLPLQAFNNIFAPIISDLYTKQKRKELKYQFKAVARWIFITSLPIFTLVIFYSETILSIFGHDFVVGYQAMTILCIGQIINAATGSVGFMLMMTEKPLANTFNSGVLCVTNILLSLYLTPRYGIIGAAFAGTIAISGIQLLRLVEVWYFLKIHPYRSDFVKPIFSTLASVLVLKIIHHYGVNEIRIIMLPFLFMLYVISYTGFLWLMQFSSEDDIVLAGIKAKLTKIKN